MNKKHIIKWSKRVVLVIISIASIGLIIITGKFAYKWVHDDYYMPKKANSKINMLYEEAYSNISKAPVNALKIMSEPYCNYDDEKEKAIKLLTNAAEKGNVTSMVMLGRHYKGYNMREKYPHTFEESVKDFDKSSYWYLLAAKRGNAEAQGEIGHNYKYGFGVKRNFIKAVYWLKKGADGDNPVAQWRLGTLYCYGLALYDVDFIHTDYWYYGEGRFISLDGETYDIKDSYIEDILKHPKIIFLKSDISKAKHYWQLASAKGIQEAKDALEKVYE